MQVSWRVTWQLNQQALASAHAIDCAIDDLRCRNHDLVCQVSYQPPVSRAAQAQLAEALPNS